MTSVLGEVGVVFDLEIKYLLPDSSYQLTLDATPSLPPTSNRIYKMKIALLLFSTTWVAPSLMNYKRRHRPIDKQKSVLSLFSVFFKMENRNKCHLMGGGIALPNLTELVYIVQNDEWGQSRNCPP